MDIALRATIAFFFVFLLMRIVGRRELGSLEPFDLILLIVLGDLVQQGITRSDYSVTGMVVAIATIGLLVRRERLTTDELAEGARLQQIASLEDVSRAILEKNGQLSFIKKKQS
jgi:uncharacterized membrane protein YcaP (DUF421 family)